jgi:hypothetical protein
MNCRGCVKSVCLTSQPAVPLGTHTLSRSEVLDQALYCHKQCSKSIICPNLDTSRASAASEPIAAETASKSRFSNHKQLMLQGPTASSYINTYMAIILIEQACMALHFTGLRRKLQVQWCSAHAPQQGPIFRSEAISGFKYDRLMPGHSRCYSECAEGTAMVPDQCGVMILERWKPTNAPHVARLHALVWKDTL